jgi:predicted metal-binding protein
MTYEWCVGKREKTPLGKGKLIDILHISHFFPVFNPQCSLFFNNKKMQKAMKPMYIQIRSAAHSLSFRPEIWRPSHQDFCVST